MNKKIATAAVGLAALLFGSGTAFALTEMSVVTLNGVLGSPPTTPWGKYLDATQFDTQGGTRVLDSIKLGVGGTWSATDNITNDGDIFGGNYTAHLQGEIDILDQLGGNLSLSYGTQDVGPIHVNVGVTTPFSVSGVSLLTTFVTATATTIDSVDPLITPNLGRFQQLFIDLQGTGAYQFQSAGTNQCTVSGSTYTSVCTGSAVEALTIEYTYHNASVPEPATLALLAIGAAGFAASRRRVSKIATA